MNMFPGFFLFSEPRIKEDIVEILQFLPQGYSQ